MCESESEVHGPTRKSYLSLRVTIGKVRQSLEENFLHNAGLVLRHRLMVPIFYKNVSISGILGFHLLAFDATNGSLHSILLSTTDVLTF